METLVTEGELRMAALQILADAPDGFMTTSELIAALEERFRPLGRDAELLPNRSDTYFSQKVRNMVSHRENTISLERQGYAEYVGHRNGLQITAAGRAYLKTKKA